MIISYSHQFIFVQVPKTAGGSIRNFLKDYDDSYKMDSLAGKHHMNALLIKNHLGEDIYKQFFSFSFVRNSWDWLVSLYHYILGQPSHPCYGDVKKLPNFDAFIDYEIAAKEVRQANFITDENGNLMVDFVGRFETLNQDMNHLCQKLNIKAGSFPHRNKSNHDDYREYYNNRTRKLVSEYFKQDIDLFGFTFEGKG